MVEQIKGIRPELQISSTLAYSKIFVGAEVPVLQPRRLLRSYAVGFRRCTEMGPRKKLD